MFISNLTFNNWADLFLQLSRNVFWDNMNLYTSVFVSDKSRLIYFFFLTPCQKQQSIYVSFNKCVLENYKYIVSDKRSNKYTKKVLINKREKFCRKLVVTQIMIIGL